MAVLQPQLAGDDSWLAAQNSETILVNNSQPSVHMIQHNRQENQPGKRLTQNSNFTNNPSSREFEENSRGSVPARKAQETVKTTTMERALFVAPLHLKA